VRVGGNCIFISCGKHSGLGYGKDIRSEKFCCTIPKCCSQINVWIPALTGDYSVRVCQISDIQDRNVEAATTKTEPEAVSLKSSLA